MLRKSAATGLSLSLAGGLLAACGSDGESSGSPAAAEGSPTTKIPTDKFDPNAPAGAKPNLPKRIGFAYPAQAEFWQGTLNAMKAAAGVAGIEILSADAGNDSNRNIQQVNGFLTRGVGALFPTPVDPKAMIPLQQRAIDRGVAVLSTSGMQPPTTNSFTGDQYGIGKAHASAAVDWINERLGGQANVALLEDFSANPALKPRTQGELDTLKAAPGVKIVAKQQPKDQTSQTGYQLMNTVLQAHPDIDVVLAADSTAVGALRALQTAGKVKPNLYVSGINGDAEALKKIVEGGPYRASVAFPFALIGYAMARYAADWLDGKSIPIVLNTKPILLTNKSEIDKFNHDMAVENLGESFDRIGEFFDLLGNISYETRNKYLKIGL